MNITKSLVFLASVMYATCTMAASKYSGDWFEIEVILLSHLDDKAKLKEVFSDNIPLPKYAKTLDLLATYLQPNILSLKQQLPLCDAPQYQPSLLVQSSQLPELHSLLSLAEISALATDENAENEGNVGREEDAPLTENMEDAQQGVNTEHTEQTSPTEQANTGDDFFDRMQTIQEQTILEQKEQANQNSTNADDSSLTEVLTAQDVLAQPETSTVFDNTATDITEIANTEVNAQIEEDLPLTEQEKALVLEAEQFFANQQFHYQHLYNHDENTKNIREFCRISQQQFEQLALDDKRYTYTGFGIANLEGVIDNSEDLLSENAYLLSKESLQLDDIVKQLRRSKNFRPMLHVAWRQQVFDEPDATPLKLYAGDNLQFDHLNKLSQFQAEQLAEQQQEQALTQALSHAAHTNSAQANSANEGQTGQQFLQIQAQNSNLDETPVALTENQIIEQAKQKRITDILQSISQVNTVDDVLASLKNKPQNSHAYENDSSPLTLSTAPVPPMQPWYIDGLLNVYLQGVYLNIAADFNVMNLTLAEQATLELRPNAEIALKPIRFQQRRRMISQEVHYFDHPYLGMIVQIRRHQRPEIEEESEADLLNEQTR